jgi:hypothetical protein
VRLLVPTLHHQDLATAVDCRPGGARSARPTLEGGKMQPTRLTMAAAACAALLAAGCAQMPYGGMMMKKDMPKAEAAALWAHIEKANYQGSYKLFPGKGKLYAGGAPHGMLLTTYVNDAAYKALSQGGKTMPAGSILVKENYMPDKSLAAITVMYKSSGFDAENNDWYWLKRDAAGKVEASGKVAGCIGCHKPSQRDYVLTPVKM